MNAVTLKSVLSFNAELLRLAATGLPLDLGFDRKRETLESALEKVGTQLTLDVGRGLSIDQAIETASYLPREYHTALRTWLCCDGSMVALDGSTASAAAQLRVQGSVRESLIQPVVILGLVYVGFISLCLVTAPKLETIYAQQFRAPSQSLVFLTTAREWMPVWVPVIPLALLSTAVWLRWRTHWLTYRWLPGSSQYFTSIRKANYAEQLAKLMESDHSLAQALSLAGPPPADSARRCAMEAATTYLIQSQQRGQPVAPDDPAIQTLPAILRWAMTGDLGGEGVPSFLRFAARTYRQSAQRQATSWSMWLPAIGIAFFGGLLVLGYSLSLFLPYIELLSDLALPRGA